jgi:hypothetical protein
MDTGKGFPRCILRSIPVEISHNNTLRILPSKTVLILSSDGFIVLYGIPPVVPPNLISTDSVAVIPHSLIVTLAFYLEKCV